MRLEITHQKPFEISAAFQAVIHVSGKSKKNRLNLAHNLKTKKDINTRFQPILHLIIIDMYANWCFLRLDQLRDRSLKLINAFRYNTPKTIWNIRRFPCRDTILDKTVAKNLTPYGKIIPRAHVIMLNYEIVLFVTIDQQHWRVGWGRNTGSQKGFNLVNPNRCIS